MIFCNDGESFSLAGRPVGAGPLDTPGLSESLPDILVFSLLLQMCVVGRRSNTTHDLILGGQRHDNNPGNPRQATSGARLSAARQTFEARQSDSRNNSTKLNPPAIPTLPPSTHTQDQFANMVQMYTIAGRQFGSHVVCPPSQVCEEEAVQALSGSIDGTGWKGVLLRVCADQDGYSLLWLP